MVFFREWGMSMFSTRKNWRSPAWLLVMALAACGPRSDGDVLASARKHIEQRDIATASIELKNLLQKNPKSGEARYLLGKLLLDNGDSAGAETELARAAEQGYDENQVAPQMVAALMAQQKTEQVLQQFGGLLLRDANAAADLKTWVASAYLARGNAGDADLALQKALQLVPDHVPALILQARVAAAQGQAAKAMSLAEALVARVPGDASAWLLQADLLLSGGPASNPRAEAAYRKVLELQPDSIVAHDRLLSMLIGQRNFDAAGRQWEALRKLRPQDPETQFFEAVLALQKGEPARTRAITQALLRRSPGNPALLQLAGQAELKLNSPAQAQVLLGKAVKVAPGSAPPRRMLAEAYLRDGQPDKALVALKPLLDAKPPDVEASELAGRAQAAMGDIRLAEATLGRAARIRPEDQRIRTSMALLQLGKGDAAGAMAELESIARKDTDSAADLALINAHLQRGEFDAASKAIDGLAAKRPASAIPDHLRGRVALQRKDNATARRFFEQALSRDGEHFPSIVLLNALDLAEQKPADAMARLDALLKRKPGHLEAQLARIDLKARGGAPRNELRAMLEEVVRTHPLDVSAHRALIDHFLGGNESRLALAAARAGVAALPDQVELLDRLGRSQQLAGEMTQAESTFQHLTELQPGRAQPYLRLAEVELLRDKPDSAKESLRRARSADPADRDAVRASVAMALRAKRYPEATALVRDFQSIRPDDPIAAVLRGDVEAHQRHWAEAQSAYREAMAKAPQSGELALRLYGALLEGGKQAEAEQLSSRWQAAHPTDIGFAHQRASAAMDAKDWAGAEQQYRALLERRPDDIIALNNLAMALVRLEKPGALPLAERAAALAPDQAPVLDTLASVLTADRQLAKAIEWQRKSVELAPRATDYRMRLVKLYLQAGDKGRARDELAVLAKGDASNPQLAEAQRLLSELGDVTPVVRGPSDAAAAELARVRPTAPAESTGPGGPGAAGDAPHDVAKTLVLMIALAGSAIAAGIPVLLVMAAMRPPVYRVERSARIEADAAPLFDLLQDLHQWERWSMAKPFDAANTRHFSGAPAGLGAVCKWAGPAKASEGYVEVVKALVPSQLTATINHTRPTELGEVRDFSLSPDPAGGTLLRVMASGPASYGQRFIGLLWRGDRRLGRDLLAELDRLKALASTAAAAPTAPSGSGEPGAGPGALGPATVAG
jgi:putative PEP-CTERM system TPR-repeat lipoprotein